MSTELGQFLRSRRERLTPDAAGVVPDAKTRRVPGLRREELAALAGVSVGYYTRLEQGASPSASPAVISALARVLGLDPAETDHLRLLAAPPRPVRRTVRRERLRPSLRDLLGALPTVAAIVIDRRSDVLAWNPLAHALLAGHVDVDAPDRPVRPNVARMVFEDTHTRALYRDWEAKALVTVAALQQSAARFPGDAALAHLVGELSVGSAEFASMWSRRPVKTCAYYLRELAHPVVGTLTLANETVALPDDDGQQLGLFYAIPGSPDDAALRLLQTTVHAPHAAVPSGATADAHRELSS